MHRQLSQWTGLISMVFLTFGLAVPAALAAPRVVATIPAVHSLAAGVMQDVGTPYLLLRGGSSPHNHALRPSDARALQEADVVFWIGEELETFLVRSLRAGDPARRVVALMDAPGVEHLPLRGGLGWSAHRHDDDGHGHHADTSRHDSSAAQDDGHEQEKAGGERAVHPGERDAHIWLSPGNAIAMVEAMAAALEADDAANAAIYRRNVERLRQHLQALTEEMAGVIKPVHDRPYVVMHDAYQYFEHAFGTAAIGSVAISPERQPGAARLATLRQTLLSGKAVCIFAEPQFEPRMLRTLIAGTGIRSGTLDPVGFSLVPGPQAYFDLMRNLAGNLSSCLTVEIN